MKSLAQSILLVLLVVGTLSACQRKKEIILGDWLAADSVPKQGFSLGQNGIAASIGKPEKQYLKWNLRKNNLILKGKYYEKGLVTEFCDTLTITAFEPEQMVVWHREHKLRYVRP